MVVFAGRILYHIAISIDWSTYLCRYLSGTSWLTYHQKKLSYRHIRAVFNERASMCSCSHLLRSNRIAMCGGRQRCQHIHIAGAMWERTNKGGRESAGCTMSIDRIAVRSCDGFFKATTQLSYWPPASPKMALLFASKRTECGPQLSDWWMDGGSLSKFIFEDISVWIYFMERWSRIACIIGWISTHSRTSRSRTQDQWNSWVRESMAVSPTTVVLQI